MSARRNERPLYVNWACNRALASLSKEAEANRRPLAEHATRERVARKVSDVLSDSGWDGPVSARFRAEVTRRVRETVIA